MFQKSKINEPIDPRSGTKSPPPSPPGRPVERAQTAARTTPPAPQGATSSSPSVIAPDLKVVGNLIIDGDLQIEGIVEGDVDARTLVVGNNAHVKGEIRSGDVTVHGKVTGRIKGQKVRLASNARVDGDITHSSLAMEEGADFEGSIHRSENPLNSGKGDSSARVMELTSPANAGSEQADAKSV